MSALDFPARALALRASVQSSQTFAELSQSTLPGGVKRVESAGHFSPGLGCGTYVADSHADQQLLSEHPAAAFESGGRIFRLLGDDGGFVTPEQFGCPPGAPGMNAQPFIQMAIRYAEAFGYGVKFTQGDYELWTPLRVPDPAADPGIPESPGSATSNLTGFPIVLHRRVQLIAAPDGTTLRRRCRDGSDPAVFANTQTIDDRYGYGYWRGGLIVSAGQGSKPAQAADLAGPVFIGEWTLDGGLSRSATPGLHLEGDKYRLRSDGTGWDIYDKPLWPGGGDWGALYVGHIAEVHGTLRIRGFAGEALWGGAYHSGLIVRGSIEISGSDAGQIDASILPDAILDADVIKVSDCYQGIERCGGWNVHVGRLVIEDCNQAGSCWAGSNTLSYAAGDFQPSFLIDHLETNRNGQPLAIGEHVRVRHWITRDQGASIGMYNHAAANVTVDVLNVVCDRAGIDTALSFNGPSSLPGAQDTHNNRVGKLILEQTPEALAAGLFISLPVGWIGSLGDGNIIDEITGPAIGVPRQIIPVPDFHVGIGRFKQDFANFTNFWDCETQPLLGEGRALYMLTTATSAASNHTVTLPPTAAYPKGARIILRHSAGPNPVITIATANTRLSRRAILVLDGYIEFENMEGGGWRPLSEGQVLRGLIDVHLLKGGAAIPPGDVSDEAALTVNGAKPGMLVRVAPAGPLSGQALPIGRVTADNTVGIRLVNLDPGASLDPGSSGYRVVLEWPD